LTPEIPAAAAPASKAVHASTIFNLLYHRSHRDSLPITIVEASSRMEALNQH